MDFEATGLRDIRVPEEQALAVPRAVVFLDVVGACWEQVGLGFQSEVNCVPVAENTEHGALFSAKSTEFH